MMTHATSHAAKPAQSDAEGSARAEPASDRIARELRTLILAGDLSVDQRLPGEPELAQRFGVSRPTVREALKRLAAQNLVRSRRGAQGGTFVTRVGWSEAHDQLVATATLLVSMTPVAPDHVAEARLALLSACAPFAAERREAEHLDRMRAEIALQRNGVVTDTEFCHSDIRFHRALVDAAQNPLLGFQMAGVIEAMQPLLNMITYAGRDRAEIAARHARITAQLERRNATGVIAELRLLGDYTARLVRDAQAARARRERSGAR